MESNDRTGSDNREKRRAEKGETQQTNTDGEDQLPLSFVMRSLSWRRLKIV